MSFHFFIFIQASASTGHLVTLKGQLVRVIGQNCLDKNHPCPSGQCCVKAVSCITIMPYVLCIFVWKRAFTHSHVQISERQLNL